MLNGTQGFVVLVHQGIVYGFKRAELDIEKGCFNQPLRSILVNWNLFPALHSYIRNGNQHPSQQKFMAIRGLLAALKSKEANVDWLFDLIGIHDPDEEIFATGYKYERPREDYDLELDNLDRFYDGLAPLDEKYIC